MTGLYGMGTSGAHTRLGGGPSSARRCPDNQGGRGLSAKHAMNLGHLVNSLIHGGKGEGHHTRAYDCTKTTACRFDASAP